MTAQSITPTSDSSDYKHTFFGILNAGGQFWTPLAFDSSAKAKQHILDFWGMDNERRDAFIAGCKIVPVRVRLELVTEATQ